MDWEALYRALVRRLVEIADEPSATERMIDYDRVARAHEQLKEETVVTLEAELCTSDDPNDHQGNTCPIHEEEEADDLITPDQIVLENRIDDMAAWLGVKRD